MRHLRLSKGAANVSHPYGGHAANDMSCGPLILASERPKGSDSGSGSGTPGLGTQGRGQSPYLSRGRPYRIPCYTVSMQYAL